MIILGPNIVDLLREMGYYKLPIKSTNAEDFFKKYNIIYEVDPRIGKPGTSARNLTFRTDKEESLFRIKYGHLL